MTELERDIKTAKAYGAKAGRKSKSILKQTLACTKNYLIAGTNRCYVGAKRVAKIAVESLKDDE